MRWIDRWAGELVAARRGRGRVAWVGRSLALSSRYWQFWVAGAAAPVFAICSWLLTIQAARVFGASLQDRRAWIVGNSLGIGLWSMFVLAPCAYGAFKAGRRAGREVMIRKDGTDPETGGT
jgi:hypothetical protein